MRAHRPDVPERIRQRSCAVSVKLIFHRTHRLRSILNRLVKHLVHIFHVHHQAHRSSAQRLRSPIVAHAFVRQHDRRIANLNLRMHDGVVRPGHSHEFGRAKGFLVKIDRAARTFNDQIGSYRVITLRNRFHSHSGLLKMNLPAGYQKTGEQMPRSKPAKK